MITLATLEQATAREVFEQIKNHMLTQNKKCQLVEDGACAYRNKEGLKCAAGCLIADDEYKENFELNNWDMLVYKKVVPAVHSKLIKDLQLIHDCYDPDQWAAKLKIIELKLSSYE